MTQPIDADGAASASPWWSPTDVLEAGETLLTWISHRLGTTSLRKPSNNTLELAQRIPSSLSITPRVPFCDVFNCASRSSPASGLQRLVASLG